MELDSNLSSLLRNLKVDDPWVPPKTWESIPSESGSDRPHRPAPGAPLSTAHLSSISESSLVRLSVNAMQGLRSAIVQIDKISDAFCASAADRTFHQVPSLWCRSSSTSALGSMLKSISGSGLVVLSIREFVDHYLCLNVVGEKGRIDESAMALRPPYSLVNQAFAVAVGKVLEGYVSGLNTLVASMKLRRLVEGEEVFDGEMSDGLGILNSVVNPQITLLEVYLHSEGLRTHTEALGNVCFPNVGDLREILIAGSNFKFGDFPRGADLLTYLYVLLRDADSGHHELLKFLFTKSCEPYSALIRSWIYHARIDDPYGEFFVLSSHKSLDSYGSVGDLSSASIEERGCCSVPCFLRDVRCPLIRAGQQLEVLLKLLNVCNYHVIEEYGSCCLANFEELLPFWAGRPSSSTCLPNQLTFSRKGIKGLLQKREIMYGAVLKKLQFFFKDLEVRCQRSGHTNTVSPFGSLLGERNGLHSSFSFASDGDPNAASITNEPGSVREAAGIGDADASTSSDSLFDVDPSQSSESSSCYSYGDEVEAGKFFDLPDILHQPSQDLFNNLQTCIARKSTLQNAEKEKPHSVQHYFPNKCETIGSVISVANQLQEDGMLVKEDDKFSRLTATFKPKATTCLKLPAALDEFGGCWPLGMLPKNPFSDDMKHRVSKGLQYTEFCQQKDAGITEILEEGERNSGGDFVRLSMDFDSIRNIQVAETLSSCIQNSWNSFDSYDLSANPMLAKAAWLHTVRSVRDRAFISNNGSSFPYFDFSKVSDPRQGHSEFVINNYSHESESKTTKSVASAYTAVAVHENPDNGIQDKLTDQSVLSYISSLREPGDQLDFVPASSSGGSGWEASLNYSDANTSLCVEDERCDWAGTFEAPLDVILDKCIVQEILVQYKYVSNFTIKLLKEGFDLHEHLMALRRYHFMEQADWADSFLMSLRNQKWSTTEPEQEIAKVQGLLELALQRSSCGNDRHKDRLYVYSEVQNIRSQPAPATGLSALNSMVLGYRVDWPINIIITQDALKTYAEIFRYLVQIRLSDISLTDVWHWLKAGAYSTKNSQKLGSNKLKFSELLKMRQQLNHFTRTLQEYVHSHLSDVSWCQFQQSLEHQVKDMLDLESVHKSYLADALHICFLSAETKPIADIIKNILQCTMDFQLCFSSSSSVDNQSGGDNPLNLCSRIDFSQVFEIKATFERNIRDLYILYLKSRKHSKFSVCRFWNYLNYNDFYSITTSKQMGPFYY